MKLVYNKKSPDPFYYIQHGYRIGEKVKTVTICKLCRHSELAKIYPNPLEYALSVLKQYQNDYNSTKDEKGEKRPNRLIEIPVASLPDQLGNVHLSGGRKAECQKRLEHKHPSGVGDGRQPDLSDVAPDDQHVDDGIQDLQSVRKHERERKENKRFEKRPFCEILNRRHLDAKDPVTDAASRKGLRDIPPASCGDRCRTRRPNSVQTVFRAGCRLCDDSCSSHSAAKR